MWSKSLVSHINAISNWRMTSREVKNSAASSLIQYNNVFLSVLDFPLWKHKDLVAQHGNSCTDKMNSIHSLRPSDAYICIGKFTITGSDNGLSPGRRQVIISTNAGILLIGHLGTNFSEILIEIYTFSFKKMHLKMSSGKWRPFPLGLNVLTMNHAS